MPVAAEAVQNLLDSRVVFEGRGLLLVAGSLNPEEVR